MMPRATAWSVFVLSALGGIVSVYYLLFSIWMTAHPLYDSQAWQIRVYERFGIRPVGLVSAGILHHPLIRRLDRARESRSVEQWRFHPAVLDPRTQHF